MKAPARLVVSAAGIVMVLALGIGLGVPGAVAAPAPAPIAGPQFDPVLAPASQGVSNDTCLACHQNPSLSMTLPSGEVLSLYVSPAEYNQSIHGAQGYACVQCHTGIRAYPHPAFTAQTRRDVTLLLYPACQACHSGEYAQTLDSVHQQARAAGNLAAAVCTDCHTAHATRQLTDPATHLLLPGARTWIPATCAQCHSAIYDEYKASVHGAALIDENNQDVPTCIDCHGVHAIKDPTTNTFRIESPAICARCHTDPQRMDKYHLSTQVLNTYVADFHGTTVTLFQKQTPDAQTNKPVCYDCHGVHNIVRVDDPQRGLLIRQNLLARCKVCHPDITANFPDAWLSHYIPSRTEHPLIYWVNVFYSILIPTVLGSMALLVVLDVSWRVRRRFFTPDPSAPLSPLAVRLGALVAAAEKRDKSKMLSRLIALSGAREEPERKHD